MWRERWIKNAAWSLKDMNKQKAANAIAIVVSQKRKTLMK